MPLTIPTVHLNGTSKGDLLEAIEQAHDAVRAAQEKLAETAPNGRDYYPQGAYAFESAVREHSARMQKLVDVNTELQQLAEAVADGGHKYAERK